MARDLKEILEEQFNLQYGLHMSITDYDKNDVRDNKWFLDRLYQQKKEENQAREVKPRS